MNKKSLKPSFNIKLDVMQNLKTENRLKKKYLNYLDYQSILNGPFLSETLLNAVEKVLNIDINFRQSDQIDFLEQALFQLDCFRKLANKLGNQFLQELSLQATLKRYKCGDYIIEKNSIQNKLYVLVRGSVEKIDFNEADQFDNQNLREKKLKEYQELQKNKDLVSGLELNLDYVINGKKIKYSCKATSDCSLAVIGADQLNLIIKNCEKQILEETNMNKKYNNTNFQYDVIEERVQKLKNNKLFSQLPNKDLGEIAVYFNDLYFNKGDIIYKQGQKQDVFYLLIEGQCKVINNNLQRQEIQQLLAEYKEFSNQFIPTLDSKMELSILEENNLFGFKEAIENQVRQHTIICESLQCRVFEIKVSKFKIKYNKFHNGKQFEKLLQADSKKIEYQESAMKKGNQTMMSILDSTTKGYDMSYEISKSLIQEQQSLKSTKKVLNKSKIGIIKKYIKTNEEQSNNLQTQEIIKKMQQKQLKNENQKSNKSQLFMNNLINQFLEENSKELNITNVDKLQIMKTFEKQIINFNNEYQKKKIQGQIASPEKFNHEPKFKGQKIQNQPQSKQLRSLTYDQSTEQNNQILNKKSKSLLEKQKLLLQPLFDNLKLHKKLKCNTKQSLPDQTTYLDICIKKIIKSLKQLEEEEKQNQINQSKINKLQLCVDINLPQIEKTQKIIEQNPSVNQLLEEEEKEQYYKTLTKNTLNTLNTEQQQQNYQNQNYQQEQKQSIQQQNHIQEQTGIGFKPRLNFTLVNYMNKLPNPQESTKNLKNKDQIQKYSMDPSFNLNELLTKHRKKQGVSPNKYIQNKQVSVFSNEETYVKGLMYKFIQGTNKEKKYTFVPCRGQTFGTPKKVNQSVQYNSSVSPVSNTFQLTSHLQQNNSNNQYLNQSYATPLKNRNNNQIQNINYNTEIRNTRPYFTPLRSKSYNNQEQNKIIQNNNNISNVLPNDKLMNKSLYSQVEYNFIVRQQRKNILKNAFRQSQSLYQKQTSKQIQQLNEVNTINQD